jgi:Na+/H+-dicarboxylate symporter
MQKKQTEKKSLLKRWLGLKLWQRIILALIAGIVFGLIAGHDAVYIKPIGSLFISAIHMMVVPVVFTAIVCAVISMKDLKKMRRVGLKTISVYAISMACAAIIGLTVATLIAPGAGLHDLILKSGIAPSLGHMPTFTDMVTHIVPDNPVMAFADGNILQILVFAVVLGIAINMAGEKAQPVTKFFNGFSAVAFKLAEIVMSFAPYGIFALMAWVVGEFGVDALIPLAKLVGTVYLCNILVCILFYAGALAIYSKLNPIKFFKGAADAMVFAFSTCSSAATLPVTIRCAEQNLGISNSIAGFSLPLGTTLNLNGLSVYLAVATVFAANMFGIHLGFAQYLTLVFSIILTSAGAGGVPGSAIIVMSAVMGSVGLPLGAIPLIAGVDRLNDMAQTTCNVTGDLFAALVVAKSEKEFDQNVYNSRKNDLSIIVPTIVKQQEDLV